MAIVNIDPALLKEAHEYDQRITAWWEAAKRVKAMKQAVDYSKLDAIKNGNEEMTQQQVLEVLEAGAPELRKLCTIAAAKGDWVWIPTVSVSGNVTLPKDDDVRVFLKWLGFEWCSGVQKWLHRCGTNIKGLRFGGPKPRSHGYLTKGVDKLTPI